MKLKLLFLIICLVSVLVFSPRASKAQTIDTLIINGAGGGSFMKIQDAVDYLVYNGITKPTVLLIMPGTYNEYITINPITGTSATNTVTFTAYNKNTTSIQSNNSSYATFTINAAKHLIFNNLYLKYSYVAVFKLLTSTENIVISNSKLTMVI